MKINLPLNQFFANDIMKILQISNPIINEIKFDRHLDMGKKNALISKIQPVLFQSKFIRHEIQSVKENISNIVFFL